MKNSQKTSSAKIEQGEQVTYKELLAYLESGESLSYGLIYDEGASDDELFMVAKAVNPENEQCCGHYWVPVELEEELARELATMNTGEYHNWSADFPPVFEGKFEDLAEYEENAKRKVKGLMGIDWQSIICRDNEDCEAKAHNTCDNVHLFTFSWMN